MKISCCIITLNEAEDLPRCLRSVSGIADEVVIVDSGSTDGTEAVAREFAARWVHQDWLGYVGQKNRALALAKHDWVLSIDADEELSPRLREEMQAVKRAGAPDGVNGFSMPRCVLFEGRWIRHGDWYPDRLVRLFRKSSARFAGGKVHERLELTGSVQPFSGDLHHYSFRNVADLKRRLDHYGRLWAESQFEAGRRVSALAPGSHAIAAWLRAYVFRAGFLDGAQGLTIANCCARGVFQKYSKLRHLQVSAPNAGSARP